MTEEMEEHSLYGWAALFVLWGMVIINAWSGAHFVSDRFADRWGVLTLHVLTAPLVLGGLLIVAWFPQRMLGQYAGEDPRRSLGGTKLSAGRQCARRRFVVPIVWCQERGPRAT